MPVKRNESNDVSGYQNLGKHHWKEFVSATGKFDPGKANFKPRLEMLHPKGMIKTFFDHKAETRIDVHYDEEFVYDYYYQRLILTMGWMDNGKIDEDILQRFFDKLVNYCNTIEQKSQLLKIRQNAELLAQQFPHKSVDEWEKTLIDETQPPQQLRENEETKAVVVTDDDIVITEDGINEEDALNIESTTEDDAPIVPIVTPKKRGRPPKD